MNGERSWFEPNGAPSDRPDLVESARLGGTTAVERGLREALTAEPLPATDAVAALRSARGRGERIVRRRRVVTLAAAASVVAVAGTGVLLGGVLGRGTGSDVAATTGPTATASPTGDTTGTPAAGPTPAERTTSYVDADRIGVKPSVAPPTVEGPAVVRRSPCPEQSSAAAGDPDPCLVDVIPAPLDPSTWTRYGDLTVLSTALGTHRMPRSVSLDGQGRLLAASGDDGWIELSTVAQDGSSITPVSRLSDPRGVKNPDDPLFSFAPAVSLHPGGGLLAGSWNDGAVMLWDVSDPAAPRRLQTIGPNTVYVPDLLFSPDGSTLAVAGYDNAVRLYRVDGDRLLAGAVLPTRSDAMSLAWSGDGSRLAAASYDETAVWDTGDPDHPRRVSTAPTKTAGQVDVGLSPDGSLLFVTGEKAGVFDVTGSSAQRLRGLAKDVDSLAVDPVSGDLVTTTGADFANGEGPDTGSLVTWYSVSSSGDLTRTTSGALPGGEAADSRSLAFDGTGDRLAALTANTGVVLLGS